MGDDFIDLHECINMPAVLIGLVPKDADLSAEWEPHANPLPTVNPGPFDTSGRWWWCDGEETTFPLDPEEASRHWPQEVCLPPSLQHGIACALTVGLFADSKSNLVTGYRADGFLSRFIVGGRIATEANLAKWWHLLPRQVAMRFSRSREQCNLRVVLSDDYKDHHDYDLDLVSLGLDPKLPYRPVIFFGATQMVDVASTFDNTMSLWW